MTKQNSSHLVEYNVVKCPKMVGEGIDYCYYNPSSRIAKNEMGKISSIEDVFNKFKRCAQIITTLYKHRP